ncbi:hypothetical protein BHS07_23765 [Myxococcus xanthus]|nr:hypothetical protein BHS07_23765 [Myxococcus xanthus]
MGPSCAKLVEELMTKRPHSQQGFRSSLGVLRLADEKKYGKARVENACARALRHRAVSYKSVVVILQHRLEDADEKHADKGAVPEHENVRGAHYYHRLHARPRGRARTLPVGAGLRLPDSTVVFARV